ncbi:MAG: iron-containing redox enzyme family protein [Pseudomonas sp.]|uniref:iron-containing redox enzyme family protein n=1 Tax=Pseudomonas sp. TaxID=306 RepID=UPI00339A2BA0
MNNFTRVVEMTQSEYQHYIGSNALFKLVMSGGLQRQHYIAYLRETYHLVRHTSRALALGGARLRDEHRDLRNWFFEQVQEENGHDLFCIKDLRNLGENPDVILSGHPMSGAWGLVCQNYYLATYGNPAGILGVATATEGLGADFGPAFSKVLTEHYGYASNQITFIKSHAGFDIKHLEEAKRAVNELVQDEETLLDIAHARRMTLKFYNQLFMDVLAEPQVRAQPA